MAARFLLLAAPLSRGKDFTLACFTEREVLLAERALAALLALLDGVALRTGAFSAAVRLTICLGRADDTVTLRLFAEDFEGEVVCGTGREKGLFAPLMTGSLMRSTQFS